MSHTGNWHTVFDSPATPKADVSKDIFTLWIAHGSHVRAGSYAYLVGSAGESPRPPVKILSNSPDIQAVEVGAGPAAWTGVVFWHAGSAALAGVTAKVNAPCLMLINGPRVTVSDPTETLETLNVEVGSTSKLVNLPRGPDAGKSIEAFELR